MPRPPTANKWVEEIRYWHANNRMSAIAIAAELQKMERPGDIAPAEKTVRKYVNEYDALSDSDRSQYQRVSYPESFGDGCPLPWDAAPAVIELLSQRTERPTIPVARWFWRVTQALPDADVALRCELVFRFVLLDMGMVCDAHALTRDIERCIVERSATAPHYKSLVPLGFQWHRALMRSCGLTSHDEEGDGG